MSKFKIGDPVSFNSEAGISSGEIIKINKHPFKIPGKNGKMYTRHATPEDPQYSIKSFISDHVAHHFGGSLTLLKKKP